MPILRTEARLRTASEYINSTSVFFDACAVAPMSLDEAVELQALREHGLLPGELLPNQVAGRLEAYRAAARALPQKFRDEIFFLRANDALFRPCAQIVGRLLRGPLHAVRFDLQCPPARLEAVRAPRVLLLASTSS